jgi:hypothetical protein
MNPFLTKEMAVSRIGELRRAGRKTRTPDDVRELTDDGGLTVRAEEARDREALHLLAALEGQHVPAGPTLVAEVNHEVVAALPLDGGTPLADPFKPTAHLVVMLELRARQLRHVA